MSMKLYRHGNDLVDALLDVTLLHMSFRLGNLIRGPGKTATSIIISVAILRGGRTFILDECLPFLCRRPYSLRLQSQPLVHRG